MRKGACSYEGPVRQEEDGSFPFDPNHPNRRNHGDIVINSNNKINNNGNNNNKINNNGNNNSSNNTALNSHKESPAEIKKTKPSKLKSALKSLKCSSRAPKETYGMLQNQTEIQTQEPRKELVQRQQLYQQQQQQYTQPYSDDDENDDAFDFSAIVETTPQDINEQVSHAEPMPLTSNRSIVDKEMTAQAQDATDLTLGTADTQHSPQTQDTASYSVDAHLYGDMDKGVVLAAPGVDNDVHDSDGTGSIDYYNFSRRMEQESLAPILQEHQSEFDLIIPVSVASNNDEANNKANDTCNTSSNRHNPDESIQQQQELKIIQLNLNSFPHHRRHQQQNSPTPLRSNKQEAFNEMEFSPIREFSNNNGTNNTNRNFDAHHQAPDISYSYSSSSTSIPLTSTSNALDTYLDASTTPAAAAFTDAQRHVKPFQNKQHSSNTQHTMMAPMHLNSHGKKVGTSPRQLDLAPDDASITIGHQETKATIQQRKPKQVIASLMECSSWSTISSFTVETAIRLKEYGKTTENHVNGVTATTNRPGRGGGNTNRNMAHSVNNNDIGNCSNGSRGRGLAATNGTGVKGGTPTAATSRGFFWRSRPTAAVACNCKACLIKASSPKQGGIRQQHQTVHDVAPVCRFSNSN